LHGSIFGNRVITEIKKNRLNAGINDGLYFFRDSAGNEINLLLEKNEQTIAIEIKAAKKFNPDLVRGFRYWQKNAPTANVSWYMAANKMKKKRLAFIP